MKKASLGDVEDDVAADLEEAGSLSIEPLESMINSHDADMYVTSVVEHCLFLHRLDVFDFLSPRSAFKVLPALSISFSETFENDVRRWVAEGSLWAGPILNFGSSGHIAEIETINEAASMQHDAIYHLERLFLRSLREDWRGQGVTTSLPHPTFHKTPRPCPSALGASGDDLLGGPVLWSVRRGKHDRAASEVYWLLRWRANVDETDKHGWSPLMWAANRNSLELCATLLRERADVNRIGRDGSSALSTSCRACNRNVVRLLLDAGASTQQVLIGNGNLDYHVGDEIMEMLRRKRQEVALQVKVGRI